MTKSSVVLMLGLGLIVLGQGCSHDRSHPSSARDETASAQDRNTSASAESAAGRLRPMQKGAGPRVGGRGYGREGGRGMRRTDGIQLTSQERETVRIQTVPVAYAALKSELSAMGKVIAPQRSKAIVSYAFPARISDIHIRIGDWVKVGQPLVTLQSEEVGNAKSEFYKALADHELAEVNFERQKRLFERGVGAKKDLLSAEADFKVAEASLDAAEKKLHVLGFSESDISDITQTHQINPVITLSAPIAGKIIQNNAVLGSMVDQETEILVIMDPTRLWIDAEVYEKDIAKIRLDQEVRVTVPAYPGETFSGIITYISDVLKEDTRTITVRTEVDNRDFRLKPGMFATLRIALNGQERVLVVPREAVLEDRGDKVVFLKRGEQYFLQVVETGAVEDGNIEIVRGLAEGEEVVVEGAYSLKSKLYEEILKAGHIH
jgi:cobalt-zinc-cadmium efflux system membrane fusion protein